MKKAFTLAEMMIVLVVIAVITAILLPAARYATPDENILKFKKAHNTLYNTVRELVNSDKYYLDGDMGIKTDGTRILGSFSLFGGQTTTDENLIKYFCNSFADIISTKSVNCSTAKTGGDDRFTFFAVNDDLDNAWESTLEQAKTLSDNICKESASTVGEEIVAQDDVIFYQTNPAATFGISWSSTDDRLFQKTSTNKYKLFCIDIDGIDKGEDPFGYGIRADGKIIAGKRADEWLKKAVNQKD